ncbi:unnamed protein product [Leptosia nina]|uniref:Uncharacterized protein n=1 Tax=Leptosia nina TaxID=320188 RepID=A0AAV1JRP9_9NEOP
MVPGALHSRGESKVKVEVEASQRASSRALGGRCRPQGHPRAREGAGCAADSLSSSRGLLHASERKLVAASERLASGATPHRFHYDLINIEHTCFYWCTCYPNLSPKREPMDPYEMEMSGRRLELPAPPGKEFRAPCLLPPPQPPQSVIQCMRPPPPPPPPPRIHKPSLFEEPSSSIPDLEPKQNFGSLGKGFVQKDRKKKNSQE